jgi:hypothetical protein
MRSPEVFVSGDADGAAPQMSVVVRAGRRRVDVGAEGVVDLTGDPLEPNDIVLAQIAHPPRRLD